mmetsp:Transcript_8294/g.22841  ORF Transcript_8294/g.22841 Transcript_8294/m.22841 type:complete len:221 (-) Transcript_8294:1357-2019(-)
MDRVLAVVLRLPALAPEPIANRGVLVHGDGANPICCIELSLLRELLLDHGDAFEIAQQQSDLLIDLPTESICNTRGNQVEESAAPSMRDHPLWHHPSALVPNLSQRAAALTGLHIPRQWENRCTNDLVCSRGLWSEVEHNLARQQLLQQIDQVGQTEAATGELHNLVSPSRILLRKIGLVRLHSLRGHAFPPRWSGARPRRLKEYAAHNRETQTMAQVIP